MITMIKLINTFITSHCYLFLVYVARTPKIYSHSKFQVYNTVLSIITMLYIRSPELITASLYPLINISSFPPLPSPWQPFYPLVL